MQTNILIFTLICFCFSCNNNTPEFVLREFANGVSNLDIEKAKKYSHSLTWDLLEEDIDVSSRLSYTTASFDVNRIESINCSIKKDRATCLVCSTRKDNNTSCPEIILIKDLWNGWIIKSGVYLPACCDEEYYN